MNALSAPAAPPTAQPAEPPTGQPRRTLTSRAIIIELGAIVLLAAFFFNPFPAFSENATFDGIEHERLAGIMIPVEVGLRDYGYIPTWNSLMWRGVPLLNNGFFFLYNPFVSFPLLLFGAVQGGKIALMLGVVIAGLNTWLLMRALGLGGVARVTGAALYMMSGGIVGKLSSGQFQLALSLIWVPLVLAGLWWTLHTTDRRAPVFMAVAFMLLFFAGNIYYTLHTLICCAVIYAFFALRRSNNKWRIHWPRFRRIAVGGVLAVLLSAVQFLPIWTVRHMVSHPETETQIAADGSIELANRYNLFTSMTNFIVPEPEWTFAVGDRAGLRLNVDYAYIGTWGFVALLMAGVFVAFMPQARKRMKWRIALIALILALLMMIWGGGMTFIVNWLYLNVELLSEFRFIGRANAIAALWWIVLAALAVDVLWRTIGDAFPVNRSLAQQDRRRLLLAVCGGLLVWLIAMLITNRALIADYFNRPIPFLEQLDLFRADAFDEATRCTWLFIFGAAGIDTLLIIIRRAKFPPYLKIRRAVRLAVLLIALLAVWDVLDKNNPVINAGTPRITDFDALYAYVREADPQMPFLIINEPDTQNRMFRAYYGGVRNWGLNEGWTPAALPSEIPPGTLYLWPRWTIVQDANNEFVLPENPYPYTPVMQQCTGEVDPRGPLNFFDIDRDFPCAVIVPEATVAALYTIDGTLPYAFVVDRDLLYTLPQDLRGQDTHPITSIEYKQDTIIIRAAPPADPHADNPSDLPHTPSNRAEFYLIVQETHFPGWLAFVDGAPVQPATFDGYIGLPLLEGEHTYTLRYQPPSLASGFALSILGLVLCGVYLRNGRTKY